MSEEEECELVKRIEITVDPGQELLRLDRFLMDRVEKLSRNRLQTGIKAGAVTVNGKSVKPNYRVRPHDKVLLLIPRHPDAQSSLSPEDIPLDIIYEDEDVLVLNKQAGMVVHPGVGNHSGTLVNALLHHLGASDLPLKEGNRMDRPGIVHRIDKNTTGLMVIAKTDFSMTHLAKQFFDHTVEREYHALVWGSPDPEDGTIDINIGRHPRFRLEQHVFPEGDHGKHAITHYKVLRSYYYVSLVSCRLETGRTHQIRVHMKALGHPLFNDEKYGGDAIRKGTVYAKFKQFVNNCFDMLPGHALHAAVIGFDHPTTGERMRFEAPLPEALQDVIDKWEHYVKHNTRTK